METISARPILDFPACLAAFPSLTISPSVFIATSEDLTLGVIPVDVAVTHGWAHAQKALVPRAVMPYRRRGGERSDRAARGGPQSSC